VRFWDSSALVPLLVEEQLTAGIQRLLVDDPEQAVWWATELEALSVIARRERSAELDVTVAGGAVRRLQALAIAWSEVPAGESVRRIARRLLRVHDLRTGDALQLAAAIVAAENEPETLELVTLDDRLARAANREGFRVLPASQPSPSA
jgi:predicted nucleic acid-binding protein